jgi:hypothetical protein
VRSLFGDRVADLTMTRRTYTERATSPESYCRLFEETFGPIVATRAHLADAPSRRAKLDHEFLEAVIRWNDGRATGPVEIAYEYLLVTARSVRR